ncbi:hypothetical protein BD311DRAFT_99111 [Dichomitus squalens]|uniref:Uncharacterized protein n=1 Tax=Dichomitus squalens TaxID=114155 RepID=A0A4Q9MYE3_9APHY|nr:hypothetical protein BD311DRAFT_99111 [Dichomitus squalens]
MGHPRAGEAWVPSWKRMLRTIPMHPMDQRLTGRVFGPLRAARFRPQEHAANTRKDPRPSARRTSAAPSLAGSWQSSAAGRQRGRRLRDGPWPPTRRREFDGMQTPHGLRSKAG